MLTAIVVLRLLAASQVALSAAALASSNNPPRVRVIGGALASGIVAYLVVPIALEQDATVTAKVLALAAELIPLLLFGFTRSVSRTPRGLLGPAPASGSFTLRRRYR